MRICLGTMQMGLAIPKEQSISILNRYLELGYKKLDTASMYPVPATETMYGCSELILGDWISTLPIDIRNKLKISTKFPNYSPRLKYLRKSQSTVIPYSELSLSITDSLKRMKVEYVDTYFIHWPSRKTNNFGSSFYKNTTEEANIIEDLQETFTNLKKLIISGYCKNIGISNETAIGLHVLAGIRSDSDNFSLYLQNPYNLLNLSLDLSLTEFCLATKIYIQGHSPLAFGELTGKYLKNTPKDSRKAIYPLNFNRYSTKNSFFLISSLEQIALKNSMPLAEISYRFLLRNMALTEF